MYLRRILSVGRYLANPRHTDQLTGVTTAVLDMYGDVVTSSRRAIGLLAKLCNQVRVLPSWRPFRLLLILEFHYILTASNTAPTFLGRKYLEFVLDDVSVLSVVCSPPTHAPHPCIAQKKEMVETLIVNYKYTARTRLLQNFWKKK